jgi:CubicO group peptidase (beta-lactamase class C family)
LPSGPSPQRARDYWPTEGWRTADPQAQGVNPALLAQADRAIRADYPEVYSLLVVRGGYLVFERSYQGHQPDDIYNIKSITKSVLSALVGIALSDRALADIDQPVIAQLPEYAPPSADPRLRALTLRHLLTMTAGFAWSEDDIGRWLRSRNWAEAALARPLEYAPGEHFNYDTASSHLVSVLLTKATQRSTREFAEQRLFRPLGITPHAWASDPQGNTFGGSELFLAPRDLAKFGFLYLNCGRWGEEQIVPAAWVQESTRESRPRVGFFGDEGYGYLWWATRAQGHNAYFALGYGAQYLYVVPDLDLVVVITANTAVFPERIKDAAPLITSLIIPAST